MNGAAMNGARVVPLLALLWASPMILPRLRWREWLGLVPEACHRLHADDVQLVVEVIGPDGQWTPYQNLTLYERYLLEKYSGGALGGFEIAELQIARRLRVYGPGHPQRSPEPAYDCEGVGGGWRG